MVISYKTSKQKELMDIVVKTEEIVQILSHIRNAYRTIAYGWPELIISAPPEWLVSYMAHSLTL